MAKRTDPILPLALSVHNNPGVYAALLGSGLSSSAGIPTGWGIILDLIRQVAALEGEEVARGDTETWYTGRFGKSPKYGELLEALARSQAERQQLLRRYFEPTPKEREEGSKVPTEAHYAIAELVEKGYVRVIVTTNFDRLMERALEERGIAPTVISSADGAQGALPLVHSPCTIVKLHGDYRDTRIRNTEEELESYPPELDRLLDQVLDEYGLIVCGWSAEWDTALRAAVERVKGHRFTTYWTIFGEPTPAAQGLIQLRRAVPIPIEGANSFFSDLTEKVASLEELSHPDPLSAAVAVQSLKRFLPKPEHRIRLHDLVFGEVDRVIEATSTDHYPVAGVPVSATILAERVRTFEAITNTLAALFVAGVYHGRGEHDALWMSGLERIARATTHTEGGTVVSLNLRPYPGLLAMYAAGLGAVAAEEYGTLARVLTGARVWDRDEQKKVPAVLVYNRYTILEESIVVALQQGRKEFTPQSNHLHALFAPYLRPYVGSEERYDEVFDHFEYLTFLVHGDERGLALGRRWGPVGRFGWRSHGISTAVDEEIRAQGEGWPLLQHGLFGGDLERLRKVKAELDLFLGRVAAGWY